MVRQSKGIPMSPIVLHIPHASKAIADDVRSTFLLDAATIEHELLTMTDAWTDEIVAEFRPDVARVIFPVSRLVVDPERFRDDAEEQMAVRGMGATYTQLSTGQPLRILDEAERRRLMETYYDPHHARLENAVTDALTRFDRCLIIDVHSFSSTPLPHEPDQTIPRPRSVSGLIDFTRLSTMLLSFGAYARRTSFASHSIDHSVGAACLKRYGIPTPASAPLCSKSGGTCT
jgi:N-formylglutamate amidohydrolase